MTTKKMICVYASNLLSNAIFKDGETYEVTRNEEKQVFIKCPIGMNLEIKMDFADQTGKWVYDNKENGTYRFDLV